jgi:hypothetical protein
MELQPRPKLKAEQAAKRARPEGGSDCFPQKKTPRGPEFGFAFVGGGAFRIEFGFVSWRLGYLDSDSFF